MATEIKILVGTIKGAFVLRSKEDRDDWSIDGPYLKGWKVTAARRGLDGDYLLGTASFVYGPAVQRSQNLVDWKPAEASPHYTEESGFKLEQIWTFGRAGDRLLAGVDQAGMFESEDGGNSWRLVEGLSGHETREKWFPGFGGLCLHSILSDPANPARLWCGISAVGVFRSDDGGASWTPKNEGVPISFRGDSDHASAATAHLGNVAQNLVVLHSGSRDNHHGHAFGDQRDRAVLHLRGGQSLCMNVADFLEFECAFQRHRVVISPSKV